MACERREELAAAKKVRALTAAEATELADLELTREADERAWDAHLSGLSGGRGPTRSSPPRRVLCPAFCAHEEFKGHTRKLWRTAAALNELAREVRRRSKKRRTTSRRPRSLRGGEARPGLVRENGQLATTEASSATAIFQNVIRDH